MTEEEPRPSLADAVNKLKAGLEHTGHILAVQGAMGWAYKGNLEQARRVLDKLPVEKLHEVSAAAALLSSLADEVAGGKS
ncbi:hypothetical protein AB0425_17305 [Actinosynnema sp. NPDC051121]